MHGLYYNKYHLPLFFYLLLHLLNFSLPHTSYFPTFAFRLPLLVSCLLSNASTSCLPLAASRLLSTTSRHHTPPASDLPPFVSCFLPSVSHHYHLPLTSACYLPPPACYFLHPISRLPLLTSRLLPHIVTLQNVHCSYDAEETVDVHELVRVRNDIQKKFLYYNFPEPLYSDFIHYGMLAGNPLNHFNIKSWDALEVHWTRIQQNSSSSTLSNQIQGKLKFTR